MKTIIAIIGDPEAKAAFFEYAMGLAEYMKARLQLLYVEETNEYPVGAADVTGGAIKHIEKSHEQRMQILQEQVSKDLRDIMKNHGVRTKPHLRMERGKESEILESITGEDPESFLVLLEPGKDEFLWMKNRHTRGLVSSLKCPVLVLPSGTGFEAFQKVVFASSFAKEDLRAISSISELLKGSSPELTVLHVKVEDEFEEELKETGFRDLMEDQIPGTISLENLEEDQHDDLASAIRNYCMRKDIDLLAMLQKNTTFLKRMFTESPADSILKQVNLPVLIYHSAQKA